jgi:hypothetical protein
MRRTGEEREAQRMLIECERDAASSDRPRSVGVASRFFRTLVDGLRCLNLFRL